MNLSACGCFGILMFGEFITIELSCIQVRLITVKNDLEFLSEDKLVNKTEKKEDLVDRDVLPLFSRAA